jgi:hypothetical protein
MEYEMSEQTLRVRQSAAPAMHLPQQTPPIDRAAALPSATGHGTPGVEADFFPLIPILAGGLGGLIGNIFK